MPASICDTVSSALRLSLTADETQSTASLDSRLYSSTKIAHLSKIEFEESGDYQSSVFDGLKTKYNVVIRPKKPALETKVLKKEGNPNTINSDNNKYEDGLPRPKRILFPLEKVHLGWQGMWTVGAGMQNVGNTCYLNSTLQALYHVPAFANWLISEGPHVEKCNQHEGCVICGMRATLHATQKSGGSPIKPWQVYSKLRLICRHLTPGRQEDAHEFLRYLVEAMEKSYLSRFISIEKLDQYSKETTPLNQILGGYLRSTVRCLSCQHLSTTYQHFQDLLLDIRKHSTLDEALDSFFSRERLEDLGYKCEACNKKVSATKQFFIERAPMVLCIALKRFSLTGGKLSKQIQFRKKICLNKYMHNRNNQTNLSYKLVSVVTHIGPSQNCGHYTAIGQAPNGHYYQFDDSSVKPLPLSGVLATHAYIMFFEKDNCVMENNLISSASTSNIVYGPQLPDNFMGREKSPIKLPFCKSDERKNLINLSNVTTETSKSGVKPPVILNSTLSKSNASNSNTEPWVVNQNGDVEKVITTPKFANGIKNDEDDNKNNVIILKSLHCDDANAKHRQFRNETEMRTPDKVISSVKIVRLAKSPLEKLEEQMNSNVQRNGSSKLVPYDSESSGDERPDRNKDERLRRDQVAAVSKPSRCVSPRSMHHAWTVSSESDAPLLSPSLNGVTNTNKKVKEKEESHQEDSNKSPNTSVSTMSPLSERSASAPNSKAGSPVGATCTQPVPPLMSANLMGRHDTLRQLQHMSHRGYGAPVDSWPGHHSNMNRQVFEERREERKRAMEGYDEMDHGRLKKVKKFHNSYNGFHGRNGYNVFQDKQNKPVWNNGFIKYHADRRHQPRNFKHHNKYNKRYNRYNSGHHYPRHR